MEHTPQHPIAFIRFTHSKRKTRSKLLKTMAFQSNTAIESFTRLALVQFVTIFDDMCKDKTMKLTTEEGVEVKGDILQRMLYEATTNSAYSAEDLSSKISMPTTTSEETQDIAAAATGKEPTPRAAAHDGIKINFKDLKKVESKNKISFPFMPDLVDYVCENTCCQSLKVNGNLFLPCGTNVKGWNPDAEGATDIPICKTCIKQGNREKYGCLSDRVKAHAAGLVYEAPEKDDEGSVNTEGTKKPKGPKKEVTFATYLAKKGDLGNDAKQRNGRLSEKISELEDLIQSEFHMTYKFDANHFAIDKTKVRGKKGGEEKPRGRPKKQRSPSVSSTSSEEEVANVPEVVQEVSANVPQHVVEEPQPDPVVEEEPVVMSDVEEEEVDDVSSISSGSVQGDEQAEPEPVVEEPKPQSVKKQATKPAKKKAEKNTDKRKASKTGKTETRVMKKKPAKSPEPAAEDGELQEETNTDSVETMERQVRRFTYKDKTYFLDKEDCTVYNENDEYVGDYDKTKGEVNFIDIE